MRLRARVACSHTSRSTWCIVQQGTEAYLIALQSFTASIAYTFGSPGCLLFHVSKPLVEAYFLTSASLLLALLRLLSYVLTSESTWSPCMCCTTQLWPSGRATRTGSLLFLILLVTDNDNNVYQSSSMDSRSWQTSRRQGGSRLGGGERPGEDPQSSSSNQSS